MPEEDQERFEDYLELEGPVRYLTPLPRLAAKVEDGKVYVKVPLRRV